MRNPTERTTTKLKSSVLPLTAALLFASSMPSPRLFPSTLNYWATVPKASLLSCAHGNPFNFWWIPQLKFPLRHLLIARVVVELNARLSLNSRTDNNSESLRNSLVSQTKIRCLFLQGCVGCQEQGVVRFDVWSLAVFSFLSPFLSHLFSYHFASLFSCHFFGKRSLGLVEDWLARKCLGKKGQWHGRLDGAFGYWTVGKVALIMILDKIPWVHLP